MWCCCLVVETGSWFGAAAWWWKLEADANFIQCPNVQSVNIQMSKMFTMSYLHFSEFCAILYSLAVFSSLESCFQSFDILWCQFWNNTNHNDDV